MSLKPPHSLSSLAVLFLSPETSFHNALEYVHSNRGPDLPSNVGRPGLSLPTGEGGRHMRSPTRQSSRCLDMYNYT